MTWIEYKGGSYRFLEKNTKQDQDNAFDSRLRNFEEKVKKSSVQDHKIGIGKENGPWMFVFRGGIELVSAFIVGILIGYGLDHWLSTKPVFIIVFSILGILAGIVNIWHLVKPDDIRLK